MILRIRLISFIFCLLIGIIVYVFSPSLFVDLENRALDYRFQLRGISDFDSRVVIVGFDQETQSWSGRPAFAMPPLFAELADAAVKGGAAIFLLDITFSMVSESFIREHVVEIAEKTGLKLSRSFLQKLGFEKSLRASLLRMAASSTSLVAGFAWEKGQAAFYDKALERIAGADNFGYYNLVTSTDRVIRNIELHSMADTKKVFAIAAVAAKLSGIADVVIPAQSLQGINFRGPRQTFKTVSIKSLIEDYRQNKSLDSLLKNKIVLIGFTDITDFKLTPYGYMPGVEVHANIIDNILARRFLQPLSLHIETTVTFLILLSLFFLITRRRVVGMIISIAALVTWVSVSLFYFDPVVIPMARPVFLLTLFIFFEGMIAYRAIYLDRKRVHRVFSRYVSDAVVKEVLATNDRDFLKGQRRSLCVMMADIRGFTTFSEKHSAEDVVTFLNQYFSRLTEIIMKNRGVVDKFLGDGILAFFNAPVASQDYVENAVASATEILAYTKSSEFRKICHGENLKVGIALHCGDVVFGNIGSDRKAEFTVIGDTVNACSRMEGLNKDYNTNIIVSGKVVESTVNSSRWKFLDKVSLRGKKDEIELYTTVDTED